MIFEHKIINPFILLGILCKDKIYLEQHDATSLLVHCALMCNSVPLHQNLMQILGVHQHQIKGDPD